MSWVSLLAGISPVHAPPAMFSCPFWNVVEYFSYRVLPYPDVPRDTLVCSTAEMVDHFHHYPSGSGLLEKVVGELRVNHDDTCMHLPQDMRDTLICRDISYGSCSRIVL